MVFLETGVENIGASMEREDEKAEKVELGTGRDSELIVTSDADDIVRWSTLCHTFVQLAPNRIVT